MNTTIFLAAIWGPVIFAIGLGIFFSRSYYIKIYRDLEKNSLAVMTFGVMAMAVGIVHIMFHNVWNTVPEKVVSFLGWGTLVKGAFFVVFPNFADKMGDQWVKEKMLWLAGLLALISGIYLITIGYFY